MHAGLDAYVVVLPVKPPARGKSRLTGLPDERRRDLAEAFALDTAAACLAATSVHAVLAVTDDAVFAARLAAAGCACVPDGGDGLNGALRQAAAEAQRR
ncbi:MAG: cofC 1, partial [Nocardioides sp.]|nr:cofC 1 [Nocardioides sp.]